MEKYMELMLSSLAVDEELKRDMTKSLIEGKVMFYIAEKTRGIGKTTIIKYLSEAFNIPVFTDTSYLYRRDKNVITKPDCLRGRRGYVLLDCNSYSKEEGEKLIETIKEMGITPIGIMCVYGFEG